MSETSNLGKPKPKEGFTTKSTRHTNLPGGSQGKTRLTIHPGRLRFFNFFVEKILRALRAFVVKIKRTE